MNITRVVRTQFVQPKRFSHNLMWKVNNQKVPKSRYVLEHVIVIARVARTEHITLLSSRVLHETNGYNLNDE